jgi:hypothetical protein
MSFPPYKQCCGAGAKAGAIRSRIFSLAKVEAMPHRNVCNFLILHYIRKGKGVGAATFLHSSESFRSRITIWTVFFSGKVTMDLFDVEARQNLLVHKKRKGNKFTHNKHYLN